MNSSTTFDYNRVHHFFTHRFNESCLLELKIILLMLAEEEHKIISRLKM